MPRQFRFPPVLHIEVRVILKAGFLLSPIYRTYILIFLYYIELETQMKPLKCRVKRA